MIGEQIRESVRKFQATIQEYVRETGPVMPNRVLRHLLNAYQSDTKKYSEFFNNSSMHHSHFCFCFQLAFLLADKKSKVNLPETLNDYLLDVQKVSPDFLGLFVAFFYYFNDFYKYNSGYAAFNAEIISAALKLRKEMKILCEKNACDLSSHSKHSLENSKSDNEIIDASVEEQSTIKAILEDMENPEVGIRQAAWILFRESKISTNKIIMALPKLLMKANDSNEDVVKEAIATLSELKISENQLPDVVDFFLRIIPKSTKTIQKAACLALAKFPIPYMMLGKFWETLFHSRAFNEAFEILNNQKNHMTVQNKTFILIKAEREIRVLKDSIESTLIYTEEMSNMEKLIKKFYGLVLNYQDPKKDAGLVELISAKKQEISPQLVPPGKS